MSDGNDSRRRMLPPIGALHSFAAAARLGSFSRAGDAVGLTQSAVSRQIALLEDWLGAPLFDRIGRRVALNPAGRAYADEIGPALDRIRRATGRLIERRTGNELSIATLPSFGMRWLAPRLPQLTARHPELVVNLAARSSPFAFGEEAFDAAIHFGAPDWPGAAHDLLFREEVAPVCSPAWLAANPVREPRDLLGKALLLQSTRRDAWQRWFNACSVDAPRLTAAPTFDHFLMLAQAAAAGAGAALIPRFLIEPELSNGTLVSPLPDTARSDGAYYVVRPAGEPSTALRAFLDWLLEAALGTRPPPAIAHTSL